MSVDKIGGTVGDPQSWNKYTYAANNPVGLVDPDGLKEKPPTQSDADRSYKIKGSATKTSTEANSGYNKVAYNCHSFAWNNSMGDPGDPSNAQQMMQLPRWDNSPADDIKETKAEVLDQDAANQVGDRVVWNDDGKQAHSAVVTEVDAEGNTTQVTGKHGKDEVVVTHPALTPYQGERQYYRIPTENNRPYTVPEGKQAAPGNMIDTSKIKKPEDENKTP